MIVYFFMYSRVHKPSLAASKTMTAAVFILALLWGCGTNEVLWPANGQTDGDVDGDADGDSDENEDTESEEATLPDTVCNDGTSLGDICSDARTVGRSSVAAESGSLQVSGTLEGMSDDNDDGNGYGLGPDQYFKIYLLEGEVLSVTHSPIGLYSHDPIIVLYNPDNDSTENSCLNMIGWDQVDLGSVEATWQNHVAATEGWYVVKNDAATDVYPAEYTLDIEMTCLESDCGC